MNHFSPVLGIMSNVLNFFKRFFRKRTKEEEERESCLFCAIKPMAVFGLFLGVFPLSLCCPHSIFPSVKLSVKISIVGIPLNLIHFILQTSGFLYYSNILLKRDFAKDRIALIFVFLKYVESVSIVLVCILVLIQVKGHLRTLNGLIAVIENAELYGFKYLFKYKSYVKVRRVVMVYIAIALWNAVYMITREILVILDGTNTREDIFEMTMKILTYTQVIFVIGLNLMLSITFTVLLEEVHDKFEDMLKPYQKSNTLLKESGNVVWNVLEYYPKTFRKIKIEPEKMDSADFEEPLSQKINKLRMLYISQYFGIIMSDKNSDPFKILVFALAIGFLVLNLYLVIMIYLDNTRFYLLVDALHDCMIFIISIYSSVYYSDLILKTPSRVQSFIYNFPLSCLKEEEKSEIEIYLRMIDEQPTVLQASGIFILESSVLVTIVGTIITYILVALQFRISYEEDPMLVCGNQFIQNQIDF